jgi:hypothetical protein
MPQLWKPATYDGKPVDCMQLLDLFVVDGSLENIKIKM